MLLPEMRLVRSAIVLAEELNFSRAAVRLGVDQSALTKRIVDLEQQLDVRLFERNHQMVELTEAGAKFVEQARKGVAHVEAAVTVARAIPRGADEMLNVGRSAHTDPWLASLIRSIQLPLYPGMRIRWWSKDSPDLVQDVASGILDLALTMGVPEMPKVSFLKLAEHPFYIAMSRDDRLTARREVQLADMHDRAWVMLSRHISPYMYDAIRSKTVNAHLQPAELHHVTSDDEAVPLILEHSCLAILTRTGAWRIARDGITMRPLAAENLNLVSSLAVRVDNKSRVVKEFVKSTSRKMEILHKSVQTPCRSALESQE